ncbi:MAG: helix-turn-helix transcriptional regulator [Ruminococcus sp.]|nr:helix-turn-helix transcriptional regulator [Ruminococcus sp.]MBP1564658.1 helix-turn-helix transcriptional regulator [Oscillospiraceae bacterium]
MKFSDKIRTLRTEQNKTQKETAEYCGVSLRTYISYEQDGRYPRKREIYDKLAEFFGTDKNYLLTEDEEFISTASDRYGKRGRQQAEALVAELSGLFAGGELSESDRDAVMIALQKAYFDCKEDNKKFTPKKYSKKEE